ncbi:TIGR03503 family protein [Aliidiomarina taiwanensis]|uniref:TIGR03503 family protein n=2 Tax=Aliidiomarina taiwanensis TaxID=946228 RepID=A0A432X1S0_9GAMM|nr:TIGR03503 family protein [Aliidiomarina taiwanensis]
MRQLVTAVVLTSLTLGQAFPQESALPTETAVTPLASPFEQQIPLADERFRIDYAVDEVTLVFYRKIDTPPVILILPDGRKWYSSRFPTDTVNWQTGDDFDLIRITKPMPGPWQVTGDILPESRVMVLTELTFHPEPLPAMAFIGEKIKVTGYLQQDGHSVEQHNLRSIVQLDVMFYSTNNAEYQNFGVEPVHVGEFLDDGKGMDEVPKDGIFTGMLTLDMVPGEYAPRYVVKTPLHQRLVKGDTLVVHEQPVQAHARVAEEEGAPHTLAFHMDETLIDPQSVVLSAQLNYPNGERQPIHISTAQGDSLEVSVPNYSFGVFELTGTLAATDVTGREFVATLSEYAFQAQRIVPPAPVVEELVAEQELEEAPPEETGMTHQTKILIVVATNLAIVAIWMLIMLLSKSPKRGRHGKKTPDNL